MKNIQLELQFGEEEEEDNIEIIGYVGVDSGSIRISDPCHIQNSESHVDTLVKSLNFDENGVSQGLLDVTIMTPCGDGSYPVFLDKKDHVIIIPLDDPYGINEGLSNTTDATEPKADSFSTNELPDI
jgi:hypothetical protein